jgi:hypothetical protein
VTFSLSVAGMSARELVEQLADPHRYTAAYQRLIELGADACGPAREGLGHPSARVRMLCCKVLDHIMDAESIPALTGALGDPDEEVRIQAVHALACDRCKSGDIRPAPDSVLEAAIGLLRNDASRRVRTYAVELVAVWVHTHSEAVDALEAAAKGDVSPTVRKKASWYAPGGTIYRRTAPARARLRNSVRPGGGREELTGGAPPQENDRGA